MPKTNPLTLKQATNVDGATLTRGTVVGSIDDVGLMTPKGVTFGQLVALRRRGLVVEGLLATAGQDVDTDTDGTPLPEDFPGLKSLAESGITTFEGARAVEDLTKIGGVGKPTAARIVEALGGEPAEEEQEEEDTAGQDVDTDTDGND